MAPSFLNARAVFEWSKRPIRIRSGRYRLLRSAYDILARLVIKAVGRPLLPNIYAFSVRGRGGSATGRREIIMVAQVLVRLNAGGGGGTSPEFAGVGGPGGGQ
ncbi:hypothetical protein C8Q79DRAFT_532385 [Trametes meyenii]|nr:hypothetical protein C8Q79DRAFT_532385 [Trametes meyenii]